MANASLGATIHSKYLVALYPNPFLNLHLLASNFNFDVAKIKIILIASIQVYHATHEFCSACK